MIKLLQGDALAELQKLPAESVDCCISSPPYWNLRDYKTEPKIWDAKEGCEHNWEIERTPRLNSSGGQSSPKLKIKGQDNFQNSVNYNDRAAYSNFCSLCGAWRGSLGLEPMFELYIKHLCDIFDEVKRILKKSATCFVNIGDTYNSTPIGRQVDPKRKSASGEYSYDFKKNVSRDLPIKSLCQIPSRFAIEMTNRGWILRNEIIWFKRNCMPSSVKDRFTVDFEKIFFFVKNKKYWFEQQFENLTEATIEREKYSRVVKNGKHSSGEMKNAMDYSNDPRSNPLGRNMRCVWDIPTMPFKGAHFAVFPEKLVEPMIRAGCPEFVCKKCGQAREKIIKSEYVGASTNRGGHNIGGNVYNIPHDNAKTEFLGYTDCGCPEPKEYEGGTVLDPFSGASTTLVVAKKLGRQGIGIELNPEYIKMSEERLKLITPPLF